MSVKIGHAVSNELGKATGGQLGDQTGKEIRYANWYSSTWTHVFRAKSKALAEAIAQNVEKIVENDNFGYGQDKRTTGHTEARKVKYELDKVNKKCHLDCSSMVSLAVNAAGVSVSKDMYTGNEREVLMKTSLFEELTDEKYLTSSDYLKRGDILLKKGHTATVLSDGDKANQTFEEAISEAPRVVLYTGDSVSIVDILAIFKINNSYNNRKVIAAANGVENYRGTASQNTMLVKLAKTGKLIIPKESK